MTAWVYILRCGDGSLYTGCTSDLDRRIEQHRRGKGARYTRGRGPLELVYRLPLDTLPLAQKYEKRIQAFSRAEKLKLISGELSLSPGPESGREPG